MEKIRRQLFSTFLGIGLLIGPMYSLFFAFFEAWYAIIGAISFSVVSFLCIYFNNRKPIKKRILPHAYVYGSLLAPLYCMFFTGGLESPLLIFLVPPSIVAAAIFSLRQSIIVSAVTIISLITLIVIDTNIQLINEFSDPFDKKMLFYTASVSGVSLVLLDIFLVSNYVKESVRYLRSKPTNKDLKQVA